MLKISQSSDIARVNPILYNPMICDCIRKDLALKSCGIRSSQQECNAGKDEE